VDVLTDKEVRVLGCLVEKEATVPDAYPLTLNALRNACNQSSSRDPIVAYDDGTVQRALDSLKGRGLIRFVHPSHGERTTKYRHVAGEQLGLSGAELAAVTVLALRGPQTAAEVRSRAERLHAFDSVEQCEAVLGELARRDEPVVVALPRRRWAHLLAGPVDPDALPSGPAAAASGAAGGAGSRDGRVAALEEEVAELRARIDRLERELGLEVGS
jgi:uncharacterized protein YceH (UPF0502 family)